MTHASNEPETIARASAVPDRFSGAATGASPIDMAYLSRYTFGNRALEVEVLQLFTGQAPVYLQALREATTEKAWRDAAHTIKGSARAVGALRVGMAAEYAEGLKSCPDPRQKAAAVEALAETLADAERFIAGLTQPAG